MLESESYQDVSTFTSGGSVPSNISISQVRVMAVRTAQATPGRRRWFLRRRMLFDVLSDYEDKDSYTIVVSFRPTGDFEGTPGQERFRFSKTGRFQDRDVLSYPKSTKRFRIRRKTVVKGLVVVLVLIGFGILGVVLAGGENCEENPRIICQDSVIPNSAD